MFQSQIGSQSYAQRENIDYNKVFSPIVKHSYIRILLALVTQYDYELDQVDVKIAFLHGDLEAKIYMIQPLGFRAVGRDKLICKLQKLLYGLKQSPRQ